MPKTSKGPRSAAVAAVGLVLTLAAGLAIAWMDTRPNWDDTGITAGALLLTAGLAALAGVLPWVAAILIAGPLIVAEWRQLNVGMLLVLAMSFAGAIAGAVIRRRAAQIAG